MLGIPLRDKDVDAPIDLGAVLRAAYEGAAYDPSIDYRKDPKPPLRPEDAAWADGQLRKRRLRGGELQQ